jgi:hypothetical protein
MRNIIILVLFCASAARGGFERTGGGAGAGALGAAYTALGRDLWSIFYNPAGLAGLRGPQAGFALSPKPFGLGELSSRAAAAALPLPGGTVAAAGSVYGFALYREQTFAVALAFRLPGVDLGVALAQYAASIERYGSASAFSVHAGCAALLAEGFRVGVRIRNLNSPAIGASSERIRPSFAAGASVQPHPSLALAADVEKDGAHDASFRAGVEAVPLSPLVVRFGLVDHPSEVCAGLGLRRGIAAVDYAFVLHQELGMTHEWSLTLSWGGGEP